MSETRDEWKERALKAEDEIDTLCQAIEGHRGGALTNVGLWHYHEKARDLLARLRGEATVRPETCGAIYPHGLMRECTKPAGHHGLHQDAAAHCWLDDPATVRQVE